MHKIKSIYILLSLAVFISCTDSFSLEDDRVISLDNDYHWASLFQASDGTIYAGGGYTWDEGVIARNTSEGWEIVHRSESSQVLDFTEVDDRIYATGYNGYRFIKEADKDWVKHDPVIWKRFPSIVPVHDGFLVIGGRRRTECLIYHVTGTSLERWELLDDSPDFFPFAGRVDNKDKLYIAGYGHVYMSNNYGKTWEDISPGAGIFRSLEIHNDMVYALSDKGALYRKKEGHTWTKLRADNAGKRYTSLYIYDENNLYISGDNGEILVSSDAGNSWTKHRLKEKNTIKALYRVGETLYIGGNDGLLLKMPTF